MCYNISIQKQEIKMKENTSYAEIIKKSQLGSISKKHYQNIINGPLCYEYSFGITKLTAELIKNNCSYISKHAPKIWSQVEKIKSYVKTREEINEKCMFTEQEINFLIKTTQSLQDIINHISEQEQNFIQLSNKVNHNFYNLFNTYIEQNKKVESCIKQILDKTSEKLEMPKLKQDIEQENQIYYSICKPHLESIIAESNLNDKHKIDVYEFATKYLDTNQYQDVIIMQAWILALYRLSYSNVLENDEHQTINYNELIQTLCTFKKDAQEIFDSKDIREELGDSYKEITELDQKLKEGLNINTEFERKILEDLEKIRVLSSSRKPKEENQQEDDEEYM